MSLVCTNTCPLCKVEFSQKSTLVDHLNRKIMCTPMTLDNKKILDAYTKEWGIYLGSRYRCDHCEKIYTRASSKNSHMLKCTSNPNSHNNKSVNKIIESLSAKVSFLENNQQLINQNYTRLTEDHEKLAKQIPNQINQIVKEQTQHIKPNNLMVHIGNNEDLFQRLETLMGGEIEALSYIVDCALGDQHGMGSGKLVKKAYDMDYEAKKRGVLPAFGWDDAKLTRIRFRNQRGEWEVETKQQFADRMTEYLQTCYTKTFQKLVKYKTDDGDYPCEWDTYRLNMWNEMNTLRTQPKFKKQFLDSLSLSRINNDCRTLISDSLSYESNNPVSRNLPVIQHESIINPNQIRPKSQLIKPRRIIQDGEDSDVDPVSDDDTESVNSSILFPKQIPSKIADHLGNEDEPVIDVRELTRIAPPSSYIPGAPPELIPIKYVSPNTITVKDLIRNNAPKKKS